MRRDRNGDPRDGNQMLRGPGVNRTMGSPSFHASSARCLLDRHLSETPLRWRLYPVLTASLPGLPPACPSPVRRVADRHGSGLIAGHEVSCVAEWRQAASVWICRGRERKKTNSSKKAPGVKKKSLLEHAEKITSELAESGSVESL